VIVAAKIAGTAIVARLFMLTQPALMQLPVVCASLCTMDWHGRTRSFVQGAGVGRVARDQGTRRRVRARCGRASGGDKRHAKP
jgi:hypothetical protein